MKKSIFAISTDVVIIPVKPNMPAITATTKKISAQFNIRIPFVIWIILHFHDTNI